jgi:hypothetical protein
MPALLALRFHATSGLLVYGSLTLTPMPKIGHDMSYHGMRWWSGSENIACHNTINNIASIIHERRTKISRTISPNKFNAHLKSTVLCIQIVVRRS